MKLLYVGTGNIQASLVAFCIVYSWYLHKAPPISLTAITIASLGYVIVLLAGYMFYTGAIHIIQVEDDFDTMQQLKVRAEAADVAKSQVLVTVSHEIRTPMNGILDTLLLTADQKSVKLADFSLATEETVMEMMTAKTGTYRWMAPEGKCFSSNKYNKR